MFQLTFDSNAETIDLPFMNSSVQMTFAGFDSELNVEEYTTIDYGNIYAELITISTLINRVGIWKADAEYQFDMAKLEVGRYSAERAESLRSSLTTITGDKRKFPSNDMVNQAVEQDKHVILLKGKMYRLKKFHAILDAFYWGVQNKSSKLNALSAGMSLTPTDFEKNIVEGKVNGYYIKFRNSILK